MEGEGAEAAEADVAFWGLGDAAGAEGDEGGVVFADCVGEEEEGDCED